MKKKTGLAPILCMVLQSCFLNCNVVAQSILNPTVQFTWQELPGVGADIGAGADGSLWYVGCPNFDRCGDGRAWNIYYWDNTTSSWKSKPGFATKIAIDPTGIPYIIDGRLNIFRNQGDAWLPIPERALDIGCGSDGSFWRVAAETYAWEGHIFKWVNNSWKLFAPEISALKISVDPNGNAWVCTNNGEIFRSDGVRWFHVPCPRAQDIAIGKDGAVWIMSADSGLYCVFKMVGEDWEKYLIPNYNLLYEGTLTVNANGLPVVIIDKMASGRSSRGEVYFGKILALKLTK